MKSLRVIVALLANLAAASLAAQTGTIQARVVDAESGAALPDVRISVEDTQLSGRSGPDRWVTIRNVPQGTHTVSAQRLGYTAVRREVRVRGGETLVLEIALSQQALALSGITVVSQRAGYAADRSATATKLDVPLLETPQSVSVVTAEQIRDQGSPNLQEALRYTPGVRHELYGVDNRGDYVGLRGSQETTTLLDGLRLPLSGSWGIVRTEPYAYERIEVLRGPASIVAGQNDPGGVVNLVSKRPRLDAVREAGVRLGNFGRREANLDLGGALNGTGSLLYRFVGVGRDGGTQVNHADDQRVLLAPSLAWLSGGHSVTLYGEYQYDRSKNTNAFLGLAGTLNPAPNGRIPSSLFIGEPDWDRYGGTRWRGGYAADLALGQGWRVRHNLRHDRVNGLMKSMYAAWYGGFLNAAGEPDENGRYMGREWYVNGDEVNITTGELLLAGEPRVAGVTHRVLLGVDGLRNDATQRSTFGTATPLDVYAPVYGGFAEPSLRGADPVRNQIRRGGLLLQDQMKFMDRLSLRLGIRRDYVRNEVVDGAVATDWATTGNAGVVYEVVRGLAPYVSYSESFNPVSGTDADGNAFRPRRGEQWEAGVKWEAATFPLQGSAAVYTLNERNRLASDPDNPNESIQIGEADVRGAELEAQSVLRNWRLMGSYSYTRATATAGAYGGDLNPDEQIEGIPEHTASFWSVHQFGRRVAPGLSLGAGARYVGRSGDGTGAVFVPAVTLVDALAAYDRGPWRLSLNVNNLTDRAYIATCLARGDCWFGTRRSVQSTFSYRW